jgi:hypothetical protein
MNWSNILKNFSLMVFTVHLAFGLIGALFGLIAHGATIYFRLFVVAVCIIVPALGIFLYSLENPTSLVKYLRIILLLTSLSLILYIFKDNIIKSYKNYKLDIDDKDDLVVLDAQGNLPNQKNQVEFKAGSYELNLVFRRGNSREVLLQQSAMVLESQKKVDIQLSNYSRGTYNHDGEVYEKMDIYINFYSIDLSFAPDLLSMDKLTLRVFYKVSDLKSPKQYIDVVFLKNAN